MTEIRENMSYEVKDWFANKIAQELHKNISCCNVFTVLKQTEKAIYCILDCGIGRCKTTWVPKSVLIENEIGEGENYRYHHETFISEDYNEAMAALKSHWKAYI